MIRRTIAAALAAVAISGAALAAPAEAAPTCSVTLSATANHTILSIVGNPRNPNRVYSFEVVSGVRNSVTRYIPTYRRFVAPVKHRWVTTVRGWVNGYRCRDWRDGDVF